MKFPQAHDCMYSGAKEPRAMPDVINIDLAKQNLVALYCDMTSEKTMEAIRRGPHVLLVLQTLQLLYGDDYTNRIQLQQDIKAQREKTG